MRALRRWSLITIALLAVTPAAQAQSPGKVDLEATEIAAQLIRAPVFARDGARVGDVADIAFDEDARPYRLRMTTSAALGLGTRTLEVPKGAFITVRGAVVLEVPAEAVPAFAELAEPAQEK